MSRWAVLLGLLTLGLWLMLHGDSRSGTDLEDGTTNADMQDAPRLEGRPAAAVEAKGSPAGTSTLTGDVRLGGRRVSATVELRALREIPPSGVFRTQPLKVVKASWTRTARRAEPPLMTQQTTGAAPFAFSGLATGEYELRAVTDSGRQGVASATIACEGTRAEVVVHLPLGEGVVRGTAVRSDGAAIDGWVLLQFAEWMRGGRWWRPVGQRWEAPVGPGGTFAFQGLPAGRALVWVLAADGSTRRFGPVRVPGPEPLELIVGGDTVAVRGRVVEEASGRSIANAVVEAGSWTPTGELVTSKTSADAHGRFDLRVPRGKGGLRARAPGYVGGFRRGLSFPTGDEPIDFNLRPTHSLRGRVVTAAGEPVPDVQVWAASFYRYGGLEQLHGTATDGEGRFSLGQITQDEVTVFALGAKWCSEGLVRIDPQGSNPLAFRSGSPENDRKLPVVPTARVTGRTLRPDSQPVPGCLLSAEATTGFLSDFKSVWTATSDTDGRYTVPAIVPGIEYRLRVQGPMRGESLTRPFKLSPGETLELDVVSPHPRWIRLRVLAQASGAPIEGARVRADCLEAGESDWPDPDQPAAIWTTDADGNARMGPFGEGRIAVRVRAPGTAHFPLDPRYYVLPESEDWASDHSFELRLAQGFPVAGQVMLPEDMPHKEVSLSLSSAAPDSQSLRGLFQRMSVSRPRTALDPDGSFRLGGLPAGSYTLTASASWNEFEYEAEVTVRAGREDVVLQLERTGHQHVVKVSVRTASGERPQGGRVALHTYGESGHGSVFVDLRDGDAVIDFLALPEPDASHWIEVHDLTSPRIRCRAAGPITQEGETVEIRLGTPQAITGRVLDADAEPVKGARVEARPGLGRTSDAGHGDWIGARSWVVTGSDGSFRLDGLGKGSYFVSVVSPPAFVKPESTMASAGDEGLVLRLVSADPPFTITVLGLRGEPVGAAEIRGVPRPGDDDEFPFKRSAPRRTDERGQLRIEGIVPGTKLSLEIVPPAHLQGTLRPSKYEGRARDVTVQLTQDHPIRGLVHDADSSPAAKAVVYWTRAGSADVSWVRTKSDGTFALYDLAAGEVLVWAKRPKNDPMDVGWWDESPPDYALRVQAGSAEVSVSIR